MPTNTYGGYLTGYSGVQTNDLPDGYTQATVSDLINRVYRDWLTPANMQPVQGALTADVDISETAFNIVTTYMSPQVVSNISPGTVVEVDLEQMLVVSHSSGMLEVIRGFGGTTSSTHTAGTFLIVQPRFSRRSVFDSVVDEIQTLHPTLWATVPLTLNTGTTGIAEVRNDVTGISLVNYTARDGTVHTGTGRVLRYHPPSSTGRAVMFENAPANTDMYVVCKSKFGRPYNQDEILESYCGLRPEWEQIVVFGTAARMSGFVDPSKINIDSSTESEEVGLVPLGSASAIYSRIMSFREELLDRAAKKLKAEYPVTQTWSDPFNPSGIS